MAVRDEEHARPKNGTLGRLDPSCLRALLVGQKRAGTTSGPAVGVSGMFLKGSKAP